jgi:hypothetical protein
LQRALMSMNRKRGGPTAWTACCVMVVCLPIGLPVPRPLMSALDHFTVIGLEVGRVIAPGAQSSAAQIVDGSTTEQSTGPVTGTGHDGDFTIADGPR